jgi:hypothetical protein
MTRIVLRSLVNKLMNKTSRCSRFLEGTIFAQDVKMVRE